MSKTMTKIEEAKRHEQLKRLLNKTRRDVTERQRIAKLVEDGFFRDAQWEDDNDNDA
jgi:hypothetical protein